MCNHEFVASSQLGVGYCRCRLCLSTFPVSMWAEQLNRRMDDAMKIIGLLNRKSDRLSESDSAIEDSVLSRVSAMEARQKEFEARVHASLTEPVVVEKDFSVKGLTDDGIIIDPLKRKKKKKAKRKRQ